EQIVEPRRLGGRGGSSRRVELVALVGVALFPPSRRDSRPGIVRRCTLVPRCILFTRRALRAGGIGKNEPSGCRGCDRAFVAIDLLVERGDKPSRFFRAGIRWLALHCPRCRA